MEPNPGITKYYPFLSDETKSKVNSIFGKAENYPEFGKLIVDEVCNNPADEELVMLAMRVAFTLTSAELVLQISRSYEDMVEVQAWTMWGLNFYGLLQDKISVINKIGEVINSTKDVSIEIEARLLRGNILDASLFEEDAAETKKRIESDESLRIFESNWHSNYSNHFYRLDDYESAVKFGEKALLLAKEIHDPFQQLSARMQLALGYQAADSLENLRKAESICLELGSTGFLPTIYNNIGFAYVALGEYDEAIGYYKKGIQISDEIGALIPTQYMNLGILYGNIGEYGLALEYAEKAFALSDNMGRNEAPYYIEMARALILSERYDEAFEYLETGGKLAIESGSRKEQGRYYLVRGILARERGNYKDAISSFNRGLKLADEIGNIYHSLQILFNLAEAEIIYFSKNTEGTHINSSSVALSRIELIAEEQRLPGLLVQVALLKAEIEKLRNNSETAREHLNRARSLCETFKIENLVKKVEASISTLKTHETRPSIISRLRTFFKEIAIPSTRGKRVSYQVYGCIVIIRDAGLEVYSKYTDDRLTSDPSLVAGLITAVSSFTKELREDTQGSLQSIVHQDIAVLLEHGEYAICALLTDKETYEARMKGTRFLDEFEKQHERSLEESKDGMVKPIKADSLYDSIFL